VLAGRSRDGNLPDRLRQRLAQESQIVVHTYDWLIRATRYAMSNPSPFGVLDVDIGAE
jgi:hypothetical protein